MKKRVDSAYILTCNVSMEYEKRCGVLGHSWWEGTRPCYHFKFVSNEVNSGFFYKSADEREKLVVAERKFTDDKVRQVIALKKKVTNNA